MGSRDVVYSLLVIIQVTLSAKPYIHPKLPNINCKLKPCPSVEKPICTRIKHPHDTSNSVLYLRLVNRCEMEYLKCHPDVTATIVPLKYCDHPLVQNETGTHYREKRSLKITLQESSVQSTSTETHRENNKKALKLLFSKINPKRSKDTDEDNNKSEDEDEPEETELKQTKQTNQPNYRPQRIVHNSEPKEVSKRPMQRIIRKIDNKKDVETTTKVIRMTTEPLKPIGSRGKVVHNERENKPKVIRIRGGIIKRSRARKHNSDTDDDGIMKLPLEISKNEVPGLKDGNMKLPLIISKDGYDMVNIAENTDEVPGLKDDEYGDGTQFQKYKENQVELSSLEDGRYIPGYNKTHYNFRDLDYPRLEDADLYVNRYRDSEDEVRNYDDGTVDAYGDFEENAKNEEFQAECPTACPARVTMVCARCRHGVYRTFLSVCHMRMYHCQRATEQIQLVSREPCAVSAPHLSTSREDPAGKVAEPDDHDRVLEFIFNQKKRDHIQPV